jgi:iron complex transport system permease protein
MSKISIFYMNTICLQGNILKDALVSQRYARNILTLVLAVLGALSILCAISLGRFMVPLDQVFRILLAQGIPLEQTWTNQMEVVVLTIRLPRVICAFLVGCALSLSGAVYQGVFKNPLVSPDLLGVSSGACVGASLAILAHLGGLFIQISAFITGIAAVLLSVGISRLFKQRTAMTLVLSGIIVGGLFSAILSLCQYVANVYEQLPAIIFWTLGSLATTNKVDVWTLLPIVVVFTAILMLMRWRLNLLSLGNEEAGSLGIHVGRLRGFAIVCSTALTASAVCISGTVGWIGLIVPHLGRLLIGSDNTHLLPASCLLGGTFLVVVDTLARNLTSSEIPLSILTGIMGTVLFVLIIINRRMQI